MEEGDGIIAFPNLNKIHITNILAEDYIWSMKSLVGRVKKKNK
jgi:hypothetical protein